jgi:methylated-DNA-[protein]-cysteine S-methyltransferase
VRQYCYYQSPIGKLLLIGIDGVLEQLHFPKDLDKKVVGDDHQHSKESFENILQQLAEYFAGDRQEFDLPINLNGTDFQRQVWRELQKIPYGKTAAYSEIAKRIGNPKACRAVGLANNKNPIPIIVPCHRIIGKDGSLTGFGGGLDLKKQLLNIESGHNKGSLL